MLSLKVLECVRVLVRGEKEFVVEVSSGCLAVLVCDQLKWQ